MADLYTNLNPSSYADNLKYTLEQAYNHVRESKIGETKIEKVNSRREHRACELEVNDRVWCVGHNTANRSS
jgi:hypothetical protein